LERLLVVTLLDFYYYRVRRSRGLAWTSGRVRHCIHFGIEHVLHYITWQSLSVRLLRCKIDD